MKENVEEPTPGGDETPGRERGADLPPVAEQEQATGGVPEGARVTASSRIQAALSGRPVVTWGRWLLELCVVGAIVSVVLVRRLLDLEQIEVGGDAIQVWEFARGMVMGGGLPEKFNHHTARFGLVLPTMFSQWVFGTQATTYYVGPLAAGVLLHLWVYLIGRKLSGPVAGAVGSSLLLGFEPMVRASSQILPEAFGPMYVALSTYLALLYSEATALWSRRLFLVLSGAALVSAYGAKESYLFFAPGLAFLVWFGGAKGSLLRSPEALSYLGQGEASRLRKAFAWCVQRGLLVPAGMTLIVLSLILMETVFLSSASSGGGRFDIVNSSHGGGGEHGPRIRRFADFFALYTQAPWDWVQALTAGVICLLGLGAFARDRRSKLVALSLVVFFLLQTFIVRSLDPLTPWIQPHPRYLLAMAGPLALVIGLFVGDAFLSLLRFRYDSWGAAAVGQQLLHLSAAGAIVLLSGSELPLRWSQEWGKRDAWHQTQETARQLTAAYRAGLPLVSDSLKGKPAWSAAAVFIDPKALPQVGGVPLSSSKQMRRYGKGRYLARAITSGRMSKSRLDNAVAQRARGGGCAIVLRQRVRFISGRLTFPRTCRSLEEEFENNPQAGKKKPPKAGGRQKRPARSARRLLDEASPAGAPTMDHAPLKSAPGPAAAPQGTLLPP